MSAPTRALIFLLCAASGPVAADESRFMSYPDVRGDRIVFAWDGDIYTTSLEGGTAVRLTSHPGDELSPRLSPDGKWIAYTSVSDNVADVWLMPSDGGTAKRLTWPPLGGQVVTWTPDSRHVVFRSRYGVPPAARDNKLYRVGLDAAMPEPLPVDRGQSCSYAPDGSRMLYVRKGNQDYYWKRYKGGQYPDIWMYDFTARSFKPVTDYVGRNAYPMWVGERMYFSSDRAPDGITNLWAQDLATGALRQVTSYTDFDVMTPSSDGRRIVYVQNGYLQLLDTAGGPPRKLPVRIPSDDWRLQDRFINPSDYIQFVDVAGDGKAVALSARGDVFHMALADKEALPRNLTDTPGVREDTPRLSPDGKRVAYFSDATGEYQLYVPRRDDGRDDPAHERPRPQALPPALVARRQEAAVRRQGLLAVRGGRRHEEADEDRRVARPRQRRVHLGGERLRLVAGQPLRRLLAAAREPQQRDLPVRHARGPQAPAHRRLLREPEPALRPGRRLSLLPLVPQLRDRDGPVRGQPHRGEPGPRDGGAAAKGRKAAVRETPGERARPRRGRRRPATAAEKKDDPARFRVDLDGLPSRIYPLPVEPGNLFHLLAGKGYVAWSSVPLFTEDEYEEFYRPGGATKWTFHVFSMKDQKEVALEDKIAEAQISVNGDELVLRKDKGIYATSVAKAYESKKLGTEVDLSGLVYRVAPREEWRQIFADAWRWYRDFFYDKDMHGRDWKAIRAKYAPYVEEIRTRQQLNWVLSEMVGELSVSHTYVSGGDTGPQLNPPAPAVAAGLLGADLVADAKAGLYRFARIYGPTPYYTEIETPLARPDVDVKEGDYLIAIDGQPVKVPENYFRLLQVGKSDEVTLTVGRGPQDPAPRTYRVKPVRSDREARYARWVTDNVDKVLKLSNGDVGYMHITAMGAGGVMQFDKFWRAFRYKKGLVIDVRGNGGGWTEYFMIDKLERQQVAFNVLSGMQPYRYPNPASRAHFVLRLERGQRLGRRGVRRALQGAPAGHGGRRAVVGRPRRDRQRPAHDRQRASRAVEQRLLRQRRQVAGREPRSRPGRAPGQRPGLRRGGQGPAAREGRRDRAPEDQGASLAVPAGSAVPEALAHVLAPRPVLARRTAPL